MNICRLFFLPLPVLIPLLFSCGGKDNPDNTDTSPKAPTAITLSVASISDPASGGSHELTITAPVRPQIVIPSEARGWLSMRDGTYKDYKMTVTFTVAENEGYQARSAQVSISAAGAATVTLPVSQQAREEAVVPTGLPDNTAVARAMELGLGWNMGNHMDAINNGVADETCWGNPKATQATFDGVKAAGFNSVRIPVTWTGHIGGAPNYKLEAGWLNRVYEIVGYARNAGLQVIVNTHHDEDHGDGRWQNLKQAVDDPEANERIKQEIEAVWTQIAEKFKDSGDFLMLESFNELIYGSEWYASSNAQKKCEVINEWNQVFVDAVRATGGNNATRWLGVPGYAASPNFLKYLKVPADPAGKTMLAFHCYNPYDYTIGEKQLPDWGHTGTSYKKGEEEIKNLFSSIFDNYVAKNIPIYMGEFGCSMRDKNNAKAWAFYLYYLEYVVKAAKTYGIPAFLWDNGSKGYGQEHHAYIDHGTGKYVGNSEAPVQAMVRAWKSNDASYTLESVYAKAPAL